MNIINTEQDFLSFIRDQAMPNGNLNIRGVARCCEVPHTSLIRSGAFNSEKLAKTFAEYGFEAGALVENGFPPEAVWLAIEYCCKHRIRRIHNPVEKTPQRAANHTRRRVHNPVGIPQVSVRR